MNQISHICPSGIQPENQRFYWFAHQQTITQSPIVNIDCTVVSGVQQVEQHGFRCIDCGEELWHDV